MRRILFFILSSFLINTVATAQCGGGSGCPTITMTGSAVNCYGGSNGMAQVAVSGVPASYLTYSWSTGATGVTMINGLTAGTYSVIVKNTCTGCTSTGYFTVNTPAPIAISGTVTNVDCFSGNDGSIAATVIGGVAPYTYSWSPSGGTNPTANNLTANNYTLQVTDSKSCVKSKSFTVTQPSAPLNLTFTKDNVDCFGNGSGSIDISPFGGTPPYNYSWSPGGQLTQDIQGLTALPYQVSITDSKGCLKQQTISITQPNQLTAAISSVPVSCFGYSNGSVTASPNGGVGPYTYLWNNSTYTFSQNSATLSNVPSEFYSVQITDNNGCKVNQSTSVGSPSQITISNATLTHVKCFGESTGKIELAIIGGTVTSGYLYQWSNSSGVISGANSNILQNIPAGQYTVLITDNNGCTKTANYEITQPQSPLGIITNNVNHVLCYGFNTGSVDITAYGGTPLYTYSWQNSTLVNMGFSEDLNGVVTGTYTVVVEDANDCIATQTYPINQPNDTLEVFNVISAVVCNGESTGQINLTTTGGTSPYSYEWNNSSYLLSTNTEDLINFPSDTYDLVVTDANDCLYSETYFIPEPDLLTGTLVGTNILCRNDATGSIDLTVLGGVVPYQYNWSNGLTIEDPSGLVAGIYSVTVTDANFCTFTESIELTEPMDTLGFTYSTINVSCHGLSNGSIDLIATGGTPNYVIDWNTGESSFSIDELTAGWYTFVLTDNNLCWVEDSIEIFQPDLLIANFTVTPVTCFGFEDGNVDITPTGGTAPYTYTWFNSDFTLSSQEQDLIGFPSDTYQLELRDSLDCFTEVFILLDQPEVLEITSSTVDVTCAGGTDGSIDINVTGGNPDYTYNWTNGYTTQDLMNVPVDEYTVVVTDTKNCVDSMTIIIYEPDSITVEFVVTEVSCSDQFDGTITAYPSGGTGNFTYSWQTGSTEPFIQNLYGGYYELVVTDIVGCVMADTAFVPTNSQACIQPPNAFTPNGDNYNDTWHLQNIEIYPEAEIKIFNRWGQLVYSQINPYEEWNAIYHGQPLPSETYYYIINLSSQKEPFTGPVTIVR